MPATHAQTILGLSDGLYVSDGHQVALSFLDLFLAELLLLKKPKKAFNFNLKLQHLGSDKQQLCSFYFTVW